MLLRGSAEEFYEGYFYVNTSVEYLSTVTAFIEEKSSLFANLQDF